MPTPQVRYAKSGDLDIAYEIRGEGPVDLVYVPGFISHLDLYREIPPFEAVLSRLAQFARVLVFDKRGTGLSSRDLGFGSLAERMDDIRAVMDDAGWARARVFGVSEGGPLALMFAATYPGRVSSMALAGTYAHLEAADFGPAFDTERYLEGVERNWGTGRLIANFLDSVGDAALAPLLARYERSAASPRQAREVMRCNMGIDARPFVPSVTVPVLVLHNRDDPVVPIGRAREMAAALPNAEFVEFPGSMHIPRNARDWAPALHEIERFLTGAQPAAVEPDRVLATVLFTDIVDSTRHAAEVGDGQWRSLLDAHDAEAARVVARFGGRVVKHTGDGLLSTFDGPARAVRCAQALHDPMATLGVRIRAGLHTGEIELRDDDVAGIGVHIAARVAARAGDGEVLVSRTVRDLVVGSDLSFEDRGTHTLKGVPEPWRLYLATG